MKKIPKLILFLVLFSSLMLMRSPGGFASDVIAVHRDGSFFDSTEDQYIPVDGIPELFFDAQLLIGKRSSYTYYRNQETSSLFEERAFMTFDISPYAGKTIKSAVWSGYGLNYDIVYAITHEGKFYLSSGDGLITPSDYQAPAEFVGDAKFPTFYPTFEYQPISLDVTKGIQDLISKGAHYAEFRVESALDWNEFPKSGRNENDSPVAFYSWGYNMALQAGESGPDEVLFQKWPGPKLIINPAPEPVSSLLFLVGGGTMLLRRFQRTKV